MTEAEKGRFYAWARKSGYWDWLMYEGPHRKELTK
jgi:hypothetical protein